MKKTFTCIIAIMLCTILTITGICTDTAYAAEKTKLKLTFKKKSVTLTVNDEKTGDESLMNGIESIKISTLKKKWGKPTVEKGEYSAVYTWEKGKSRIAYTDNFNQPHFSNFTVQIKDKNVSFGGLKIGMKKSEAEKIINGFDCSEKIMSKNSFFVTLLDHSRISISCSYKKGKVSEIFACLYVAGE